MSYSGNVGRMGEGDKVLKILHWLNEYKKPNQTSASRKEAKDKILWLFSCAGINIDGAVRKNLLSYHQRICLALAFLGVQSKQIAFSLQINLNSVKTHYRRVYKKLNVRCKHKAIYCAFSKGYLGLAPNFFLLENSIAETV